MDRSQVRYAVVALMLGTCIGALELVGPAAADVADGITGPAQAMMPAVRVVATTTTSTISLGTCAAASSTTVVGATPTPTTTTTTTATATTTATTTAGGSTTTTAPASIGLLFPMQVIPDSPCVPRVPACEMLNNFGDSRPGGRIHEGTDILGYYKWDTIGATPNQAVYAVIDGKLSNQVVDNGTGSTASTLSGNSWRLNALTGKTYYMYAHLDRFAAGLQNGSVVSRGQIIGYVGDTGDAGPGNDHLHFEVHPTGASHSVVDPVPLLMVPAGCTLDRR